MFFQGNVFSPDETAPFFFGRSATRPYKEAPSRPHRGSGVLDIGGTSQIDSLQKINYPLVNDHSWLEYPPFSIGNTSTQSGSMFQPAMLDYPPVTISYNYNARPMTCKQDLKT